MLKWNNRNMLADLLPSAFTGDGIFSAMVNPIWCYDFDPAQLDIYFISNYGEKLAAPYLDHISDGDILTSEKIYQIANTIYSMYRSQWEHLYNAYKAEYNPIHNTDSTEVETIKKVGNETANQVVNGEVTGTSSSSSDSSGSGSVDNKRSGFNSTSNVNDTSGTNTSSSSIDSSGRENTETVNESENIINNTEDTERTHRKYGNIGVMTSAQLIGGEIELWKWNFIKSVMMDISDTIALSIY